jgi:hypothetical protein
MTLVALLTTLSRMWAQQKHDNPAIDQRARRQTCVRVRGERKSGGARKAR